MFVQIDKLRFPKLDNHTFAEALDKSLEYPVTPSLELDEYLTWMIENKERIGIDVDECLMTNPPLKCK